VSPVGQCEEHSNIGITIGGDAENSRRARNGVLDDLFGVSCLVSDRSVGLTFTKQVKDQVLKRCELPLHNSYISHGRPRLWFLLAETLAGEAALNCKVIAKDEWEYLPFPRERAYRSKMGIFHHFMNLKAVYIHWGWFQISITNLLVILFMLALFGLALVLPFPGNKKGKDK
jgi:hypothetical protein